MAKFLNPYFILFIGIIAVLNFQNCSNGFQGITTLTESGSSLRTGGPDININGETIDIDAQDPLGVYAIDSKFLENEEMVISIRLNKPDTENIDIAWETVDGVATAGIHYVGGSGSASILSGEEVVNIRVPVLKSENIDIMFELRLISSTKGEIRRASAFVLIPANSKMANKANKSRISSGSTFTCSITAQDTVSCWGKNILDIYVDGSTIYGINSFVPVAVASLQGVKQISSGGGHACAITAQDTVSCWGRNVSGQLGNNSRVDTSLPVAVANLQGVKQISSGFGSTCVITAQDTVSCWGSNNLGQLGNNSTVRSSIPVAVANLQGVKQISSGGSHTCVITAQDTVSCWGRNFSGQLGNNSTVNSSIPVAVANLQGAKQVSLGGAHTCVTTAQDTVSCWGHNLNGQLGNNSSVNSSIPVAVANLQGVKQVSLGGAHTCVTTAQDTVSCWGVNNLGQLGNNSTVGSLIPIATVTP